MGAASVTGTGPGSADKSGSRGYERNFVAIEKLIGTHVIFSGAVDLSFGSADITFPNTLDDSVVYIVLCGGSPTYAYASDIDANGFTINGNASETVSFIAVSV